MKKFLLTAIIAMVFGLQTMADDTQRVVIDGTELAKTVNKITFNDDQIILHFTDGTTYEGDDLSLVVISFDKTTGISTAIEKSSEGTVWYDLSGRLLPGTPTKSGTYIKRTTNKSIKVKK